jgi:hypothetical protein
MRSLGLASGRPHEAFSLGRGNLPTLECLTEPSLFAKQPTRSSKAPKVSENDARRAALAFEREQEGRENAALEKKPRAQRTARGGARYGNG